ncbi:MAG: hypothetical protein U0231_00705 [Nitrospiraceae bacterium]
MSRDFIYVDDIVRGLIACAERGRSWDVHNLASGVETSILEPGAQINTMTNNASAIQFLPRRN